MDGSRTHHGSHQPDTDFEDQEAHRDLTIPINKYSLNLPALSRILLTGLIIRDLSKNTLSWFDAKLTIQR